MCNCVDCLKIRGRHTLLLLQRREHMPIYRKERGGRWYLYEQHSYRQGGKVRTRSRYLGPESGPDGLIPDGHETPLTPLEGGVVAAVNIAAALIGRRRAHEPINEAQEREDRALTTAERKAREIEAWQREMYGETAAERSAREKSEHWSQEKFLADTQSAPKSDAAEKVADAPDTSASNGKGSEGDI